MNFAKQYKAKIIREAMKSKPHATGDIFASLERIQPHAMQQQMLQEQQRFNVAVCGRRFGKTVLCEELLLPMLRDGLPCAYFAPTYKMLSLVWKHFKNTFHSAIHAVNVQEKRLEFKNGSSLDFWSLDSYDSVRGRKYACAVIDEAAMSRYLEDAWLQAIRPTLTDYQGSAWFLSTPKGMNFFHSLFEKGVNGEQGWQAWQFPTLANPHIAPVEIDFAKRELPELVFMQEYEAQFVEMAGTLIKREYVRYGEPEDVSKLKISMAVDLAISTKTQSDYTAAVVIGREESTGAIYILDAKRIRADFQGVLAFVRTLAEAWQPREIGIENVQYQASVIQELRRTTALPIRAVRPEKDKITRFMPLQTRYEQGLVYHTQRVSADFEKELLSFPEGAHDDMIDAAAYAFALQNKQQVRFITFD